MKIRIPNRLREELANIYLKGAEILPHSSGRTISTLQTIRKYQQRDAEKTFEKTRPPEGFSFEYLYFRLFELFPIEQIDQLRTAIIETFPNLDDKVSNKAFSEDLIYYATNVMQTVTWFNLGFIVRNPSARLFPVSRKVVSDLPPEVDYVKVGLKKIIPSVFILTMDVYLTSEATKNLLYLQNLKYPSRIRFHQLIPHGRNAFSHLSIGGERVMTEKIDDYLRDLRAKTEKKVSFLLDGYFSKQSKFGSGQLPYIDVFAFKGVPKEEDINEWIDMSREWWSAFGFNFYGYGVFSNGRFLFTLAEHRPRKYPIPYRLIVLWESFLDEIDLDQYGGDEEAAIRMLTSYDLDRLQLPITLLKFLKHSHSSVGNLRRDVLERLHSLQIRSLIIHKMFRLNAVVLQTLSLFNRISLEFKENRNFFERDLREIDELKSLSPIPKEERKPIGEILINSIEFQISSLKNHLSLVEDSFTRYVSLRNMAVIYYLTLVLIVITTVGIIGPSTIKDLLLRFGRFLSNLLFSLNSKAAS